MPRSRRVSSARLAILAALFVASPAAAQPPPFGDYGDAPEAALAYPSTGQMGTFPTCYLSGGSGYVYHGNVLACWLGLNVDWEGEGASGGCPAFGYEADECYAPLDFDAGLLGTFDTYTIAAGVEVPCNPAAVGVAMGRACNVLAFGPTFDLFIVNNAGTDLVLNAIFDWDGDGRWGGVSACPNIPGGAREHALVNFVIPIGYVGALSGLAPPAVVIGPRAGFVWARFTLSEQPGPLVPWNGSGHFDIGESEDYLVRVEPDTTGGGGNDAEYGDAPEDATAYPDGTVGKFPTCIDPAGPSSFIVHTSGTQSFFGPGIDFEADGNAGQCPQPPYDADECARPGGDAGLIQPQPFTLDPATLTAVSCPLVTAGAMGVACGRARWGPHLDIEVTNLTNGDAHLQVLADWNRDGAWDGTVLTCPGGVTASEQVLRDFVIPAGFSGPLSLLSPPSFEVPADPGLCWFRFSLTDPGLPPDWDGSGSFAGGETEDYLLFVGYDPIGVDAPGARSGEVALAALSANPFRATAHVGLTLPAAAEVTVRVLDLAGRIVTTLVDGRREAGRHLVTWSGLDARGRKAPSGIYFVEARAGDDVARLKLTRLR